MVKEPTTSEGKNRAWLRWINTMMLPPPECKVYTPPQLADAMVRAVEPNRNDYWLDPCIGPGAFIAPLRQLGFRKNRIVGIDIDTSVGSEDGGATTIRGVDFFQWCAGTKQRFTKIVANPPYVAIRKLHPTLQQSLRDFGRGEDASFALRSNYWCAFLAASLRVLEQDGSLSFVLPAAWEYALYAERVRQYVLGNFQSVHVHRCLQPLFSNVREGCVVLVALGHKKKPTRTVSVDYATSESLIVSLARKSESGVAQLYQRVPSTAESSSVAFSEIYSLGIGCVTGDARYFLLTEADRIRHNLPLEAVRPVLSKARHLATAQITKAHWMRLLDANERVWLFNASPRCLKRKAVQAYLEYGKKVCDLNAYKLKHRDPWYEVRDIRNATGFLSGMTRLGPWISFRSMRNLAATNTLYVLAAKSKMSVDENAAWGLSLLSTPSRRQFMELVRRYPDGLAKLEPHDLNSFQLTPPRFIAGAAENYCRAVKLLLTSRVSEAVAIADAQIGGKCT
jgi:adenine-specific DNA-methyltransferase